MDGWHELINILILLSAALVLGTIAEQLRQSAIIGYLLAGMLVGPNVMGMVGTLADARVITEMGAALLLFSIGLEFSFKRLVRMGAVTAATGFLQIVLTWAAGTGVSLRLGLDVKAAVVIGAAVSLSSTASVFRLLSDKTMMDSLHGRASTGVLLLQDAAVVPMVLLITAMSGSAAAGGVPKELGRAGLMSAAAFIVMYVVINRVVPRALNMRTWTKNRELPIILSLVLAAGSALGAHEAGISPAFGAFLAGMLLAESPFATQIRADVGSVRAVLVTLFFAAVGMYADPGWIVKNAGLVISASSVVIVLKTGIVIAVMLALRFRAGVAVAAGLCLSQIGEFSFVLTSIAMAAGTIDENVFRLVVSATIVTLLATPYLVGASPRVNILIHGIGNGKKHAESSSSRVSGKCAGTRSPIIVAGFGPAGKRLIDRIADKYADDIVVLDVNPKNARAAREYGVEFQIGDACNVEVLEHAGIRCARVMVVTLPDPEAAKRIIRLCKDIAPHVSVVSRVRYDIYERDILNAGADSVVNEENTVGVSLSDEVIRTIEKNHVEAGKRM
ncbi:MAG: cation:proton antiporter [bacterium]